MEYVYSDGCWTPTHIVHGRIVDFFTTTAKTLRCMAIFGVIISGTVAALRLHGTLEGPPQTYVIINCAGSSTAVFFMLFRFVTDLVSETVEVIVCAYIFFSSLAFSTISAFLFVDELDMESATRATLVRPQIIAALVMIASYLEACGTKYTANVKYCGFFLWILSTAVGIFVCISRPMFYLLIRPMVICGSFQLVVMISPLGFARQAIEWARLTSDLLETAFDATFVLRSGDSMLVDASSSSLDAVFHKEMQGCALDDTVIINGVEAVHSLCNHAENCNEALTTKTTKRDGRRCAFVTCRDDHGWEFDAELRTAPQLVGNVDRSSIQLCGLIIFGEKRPPLDTVCHTADPILDGPVLADKSIVVAEDLSSCLGLAGRPGLLIAIPEDEVSLGPASLVSQEESLGTQVDTLMDIVLKLKRKSRAEKDRAQYKRYRLLATHLQDAIDDLLHQTQSQLPCVLDQNARETSVESGEAVQMQSAVTSVCEMPRVGELPQVRLRPSPTKQQD